MLELDWVVFLRFEVGEDAYGYLRLGWEDESWKEDMCCFTS